jgi:hypothetical protein
MNHDHIRNKEYMTQFVNYSGMNFGTIRPMDIDGFIEYKDKAYLFYEVKFGKAEMPGGQKLALVRLADDLEKVKPVLLVICSHDTPAGHDIYLHELEVTEYRSRGIWRTPPGGLTVLRLTQMFLEWVDGERAGESG